MGEPLVTVICLCYNHATHVVESLDSVLAQTYGSIQLIIIDDASTDGSQSLIRQYVEEHSLEARDGFHLILNSQNKGNTASFNSGLALADGQYVIDLATDDMLLPKRVEKGVRLFEKLGDDHGVIYCNVQMIGPMGEPLGHYYPDVRTFHPSGNLFGELVRHTFISPPGMMMRKEVLDRLGGYDEALSYEDYDFWVRSSRYFLYAYQDEVLVRKRELPRSFSKGFQDERSAQMLTSTLRVCEKARLLCRDGHELAALGAANGYYLRQCALLGHADLAAKFLRLQREIGRVTWRDTLWAKASALPMRPLYKAYRKMQG